MDLVSSFGKSQMTKKPGTPNPDYGFVVRRRLKMAVQIRKLLYDLDQDLQGLPPDARTRWGRGLGRWPRTGRLTYREVLAVAENLSQMPEWVDAVEQARLDKGAEKGHYNKALHWMVWRAFKDQCVRRIEELEKTPEWRARYQRFLRTLPEGRRKQLAQDALSKGLCPVCADDVRQGDACGHGYGHPKVDSKGGTWYVDPR